MEGIREELFGKRMSKQRQEQVRQLFKYVFDEKYQFLSSDDAQPPERRFSKSWREFIQVKDFTLDKGNGHDTARTRPAARGDPELDGVDPSE
jgi:hypothetical protein